MNKRIQVRSAAGAALTAMLLGSGLATVAGTAQAAAPMAKMQAPGFYRMMLGDFEVTAISDGSLPLPVDKLLTNISVGRIGQSLSRSFLKTPVETSVNAYLINTGAKLVLIDTGTGALFGPTLGKLAENIKAAGYQPDQVDEVYITHLHPDHVGELMAGDKIAFANAVVRADQHDADFWLSEANMKKAPKEGQGFYQGAMASLNPYLKAGKFKSFEGDTALVDGVKAAAQRKKAYAAAAKGGNLVGSAHLSFPGLGHLRGAGKGYDFIPVNYISAPAAGK